MSQYRQLHPGEAAPWFRQQNTSNPSYAFDTVAGRYIVLCFFGTAGDEVGRAALEFTVTHRALFDDQQASFFGVSVDPDDAQTKRVRESLPGIRHFWDFDGTASRLYGALPLSPTEEQRLHRLWVVLDPGLNVLAVLPFSSDGSERSILVELLTRQPPLQSYAGVEMHAPVIILPNVFDSTLCTRLIEGYNRSGGEVSGFMQEIEGKTVAVHDVHHKKRADFSIEDEELRNLLQRRIRQKVVPMIRRAFCFEVTRMERYIVGCYDSNNGGHFRAHRDNTTRGTAHRRFALSLNLNDDFEGGELSFPEYGPRSYKMRTGSAVIFSGSLLHQVSPVTRGRRYAFLPFLYDDAAAALRESNNAYLDSSLGQYLSSSGAHS